MSVFGIGYNPLTHFIGNVKLSKFAPGLDGQNIARSFTIFISIYTIYITTILSIYSTST